MYNNKGKESDNDSENEDVIQPKLHRTGMLQHLETIEISFQTEENVPTLFIVRFYNVTFFMKSCTVKCNAM